MSFHVETVGGPRPGGRDVHYERPLGTCAEFTEDGDWLAVITLGKGSGSPSIFHSTERYSSAEQAQRAADAHLKERLGRLLVD